MHNVNKILVHTFLILPGWQRWINLLVHYDQGISFPEQEISVFSRGIQYSLTCIKQKKIAKKHDLRCKVAHLHISHNTACLPPKILHKHCLQFLLGPLLYPGETKNKGYAKFWGADKVYYGRCANGEFERALSLNPLSPNIHIQILQTDLHTSPLRMS